MTSTPEDKKSPLTKARERRTAAEADHNKSLAQNAEKAKAGFSNPVARNDAVTEYLAGQSALTCLTADDVDLLRRILGQDVTTWVENASAMLASAMKSSNLEARLAELESSPNGSSEPAQPEPEAKSEPAPDDTSDKEKDDAQHNGILGPNGGLAVGREHSPRRGGRRARKQQKSPTNKES